MSSAKRLAFTRIVVCAALIVASLTENSAALAWLPASLRSQAGLLNFIPDTTYSHNPVIWTLVDIFVPLALLIALVGYRTRLSLLVGAGGYFVKASLIRAHTLFYHNGLVPMEMAFLLVLTPCGDVFSLDARWRKMTLKSEEVYRWATVLVLMPLTLLYLTSGLSKLRYARLNWFRAGNMQELIAESQYHILPPLIYATTWINSVPPIVWTISAVMAIITELGYISVLWSQRARWVFPVLAGGMHIIIWLLMGVGFPDLILLQIVVFPVESLWSSFVTRFSSRGSSSYSASRG